MSKKNISISIAENPLTDSKKKAYIAGKNITKIYGHGSSKTIAVNNVDFEFLRGDIISIVGESGSGKTTLANMVLGLTSVTDGVIEFDGSLRDISNRQKKKNYWKNIQAIFQDPFSTFNIFRKVDSVLNDCIRLIGHEKYTEEEKKQEKIDACRFVNMKYEEIAEKYPFEMSGGQMQRLMIARIFMLKPNLLIADEPTSMVDASSRATILDMLLKLRSDINMTVVFITHDIGLAYYISDYVYIMENGNIVEQGTADEAILNPKSDYTKRLLGDVPKINEKWDFVI